MKTLVESLLARGIEIAIFDIDDTLSKTNILKTYIFLIKKSLSNPVLYFLWLCQFFIFKVPFYLCFDAVSRELFLTHFYKKFNNGTYDLLENGCREYFNKKIKHLLIPETLHLLTLFKEAKIKIVLVSLGISPLVEQYARYFSAEYYCIPIENRNNQPVVILKKLPDFKLNHIKNYPSNKVVAIADSIHDRSMLSYCDNSIIISHGKPEKWMGEIKGAHILQVK